MRRLRYQAGGVHAAHREDRGTAPEEEGRLNGGGAPARIEIERDARVENVAAFRNFIEEACRRAGADESLCFDLKLAVDEACSNLVVHGYEGQEPGPITVSFAVVGDEIVITIADHAAPFYPEHAPEPLLDVPASERRPGGLGWHLIKQIADRLEYETSPETGNRLTMIKKFVRRPPE